METKKKKRGRKPALAHHPQQSSLTSLLSRKPGQDVTKDVQSTTHANLTQNGHARPTTPTKRSIAPFTNLAIDLEVDPNNNRRKRRKTVSPSSTTISLQSGDWESQLREAAYGSEPNAGAGQIIAPKPGPQPQSNTPPQTPESKAIELVREKNGHTEGASKVISATKASRKTPSPPKKTLKLRKDGKLGSPKAKQAPDKEKPKRRRAVTKSPRKGKIVAFKYGKDAESRVLIGQKIEQVLSSPIGKPQVQVIVEKASSARQVTPQPVRATHPFFLPKHAAKDETDTTARAAESGKPIQVNAKASSQKNAQQPPERPARAWPTFSGNSNPSNSKYPGSKDPPWPTEDNFHVYGEFEDLPRLCRRSLPLSKYEHPQKLKDSEVRLYRTVLDSWTNAVNAIRKDQVPQEGAFRRMKRKLMTGLRLQNLVTERLGRRLIPMIENLGQYEEIDELDFSQEVVNHASSRHHAIERLCKSLPSSSSAFDHFQCEPQSWIDKYAPTCAAEVLQQGKEVFLLRDWLQRLIVSAVEVGNTETKKDGVLSTVKQKRIHRKRKRKRAEQLDGFVVSSDEEANEMDELTDPDEASAPESAFALMAKKSVVRTGETLAFSGRSCELKKDSHAVVISGPHGCGKTAAVFAVARELGFEIFEINAGLRRSGKDLMDKVGDMTRNHLVQRQTKTCDTEEPSERSVLSDPDEVRQSKLHAFLKPKTAIKKSSATNIKPTKAASERVEPLTKPKVQKQSLILLEEVDLLFEEDKHFWPTVLELIAQSKRPIILTCSDESRLPIEELPLHAIFRLKPPPEPLLTDYLLLLAASEGHLLHRKEVSSLSQTKHNDLRASTLELNFWCQMGIGDRKGGLEWLPIPSNSISYYTPEGDLQRVISDDTYHESLSNIWPDLSFSTLKDVNAHSSHFPHEPSHLNEELDGSSSDYTNRPRPDTGAAWYSRAEFEQLRLLDRAFDAMSVADVFPSPGYDNYCKVRLLFELPTVEY